MKHKKLLCFGMAAVLACIGLPGMTAPVRAMQTVEESMKAVGIAGDCYYEEREDGTLMITGCVGGEYSDNLDLVIPSEIGGKRVTGIADSAFRYRGGLNSVIIPESVTSIGAGVIAVVLRVS